MYPAFSTRFGYKLVPPLQSGIKQSQSTTQSPSPDPWNGKTPPPSIARWEIDDRVPRECRYCQAFVEEPPLHHVLVCPILENIRAPRFRWPSPHAPLDAPSAAICVSQMLQSKNNFDLICTSPPPRWFYSHMAPLTSHNLLKWCLHNLCYTYI